MKLFSFKKNTLFTSSSIVFFFRIIGMTLSYTIMLIITNSFGAEIFGRYSITLALVQFLVLISSLGLTFSVLRLTADHNNFLNNKPLNKYLYKTVKVIFLSSITFAVVLFLIKEELAVKVFKDEKMGEYFKYLSFFLVFLVFHTFFSEFIRAKKKFQLYGFFMYSLPYLIFIIFLGFILFFDLNEYYIIKGYLCSITIVAISLLLFFPFKVLKSKTEFSYKRLFSISFPMMFSATFIFVSEWTDIFMLGAMVSKAEVGVYNAAFKLATIAIVVINAVNTVLGPKIAELYGKNELLEIRKLIYKSTRLITIVTLPIIIISFRIEFLSFFGKEFIRGSGVLIIVSIGLLFNAISGSVAQLLNMTNHQKELRNITIITVIINMTLNFILIPIYGIIGAAVASLISNMGLNIICILYIKKKFGFYTFVH